MKNAFARLRYAFSRSTHLRIGTAMFSIVLLLALLAPILAPYDVTALGNDLFSPPCAAHWFGTDGMGRDVLSMVLMGARTSLLVGFIAAAIGGILGTLIGGFAGYLGGKVDRAVTEITNVFLMLPVFFLVLLMVALFGSNLLYVMLIIGLTSWPGNARLMRAQALSLRERVFVLSARAIGEGHGSIFFRYILPNGIHPILSNTAMGVAGAILIEASLSFLGLGDPNRASWGRLIFEGRSSITRAWWITAFAGIAVVVTVLAFYLISDGLNKVLNPRTKGR